jgi:cell division protein FtsI (penicillin-binding protein 3)
VSRTEIKTDHVEENSKHMMPRVFLVYGIMFLFGLLILGTVIRIQFVEAHEILPASDDSTSVRYRTIPANRGSIYSADGKLMATSVPVFDLRMDVDNPMITEAEFLASLDSLAMGLQMIFRDRSVQDYKALLQKGRRDRNRYLLLKRKVSYEELKLVRTLPILRRGRNRGGLITEPRDVRQMPYRNLAYRTIGWDKEGIDLDVGLEGAYSKQLSGVNGVQLIKQQANGVWKPVVASYLIEPEHGMDIHTTIDMYIQDVAEHALMRQLQASQAHHGCVIVMEVSTGHIKAIANLQRNPGDSTYVEMYNHALGESYEPGSTFKLASLMAALEDGFVTLEDTVNIGQGSHSFYGYEMKDASSMASGRITLGRAFEVSSNVGISKSVVAAYGQRPARFTERLGKMRFGQPVGLEIAGEGRPMLKSPSDPSWSRISLPWMAIGYEVKTTPLQLLTFYNAVANDGRMVKPLFVTHISSTGKTVREFTPQVLNERIASPRTIKQMQELLVRVVDYGTATNIRSNIYKIAGKTGTAKIAAGTTGYASADYTASFAGYFPADQPKYSCIVVINKPVGLYYGGHIAAPVFRTIADKVYATFLDQPHAASFAFRPFSFPRPATGLHQEQAWLLRYYGINITDTIRGAAWVSSASGDESIVFSHRRLVDGVIPDLRGMLIRDVIYLLENQGVRVVHQGRGRVVQQSVPEGTPIQRGSIVKVTLEI